MSHDHVYKWFELQFPSYAGKMVEAWFPYGPNCVKVIQKNGSEYVFTFNSKMDWSLETLESFKYKRGQNDIVKSIIKDLESKGE